MKEPYLMALPIIENRHVDRTREMVHREFTRGAHVDNRLETIEIDREVNWDRIRHGKKDEVWDRQ